MRRSRGTSVVVVAGLLLAWTGLADAQDEPQALCEADGTDLTVVAEGNQFTTDCLAAPPNEDFTLTLENRDRFSHNVSIYEERGGEALFTGPYVTGDTTTTYEVPALEAGTYVFVCDIHPHMDGTFLVAAPGEAPQQSPGTGTEDDEGAPQGPTVQLELVASGLVAPVFITSAGDGSGRLFVVDQTGSIRLVDEEGTLLEEPFLDVSDRLVELDEEYDERGLLGLAFHPQYAENGRFFVYYSAPLRASAPDDWDHTSHLSEFRVSSQNPNIAAPESERVVMRIDQPQYNHNGGHIAFGADGHLYIPLGDGGAGNDVGVGHVPQGNAQDTTSVLGSVLRIDVDGEEPYGIPQDNPFAGEGDEGADEIFAYGFRNPYHLSFDSDGEREAFVADAGQDRYEEVSIVRNGGNYGWRIKEATHCFDPESPASEPDDCPDTGADGEPLIDPVIEYSRLEILGSVIIGGYVYRGQAMPELEGRYVFGDYSRDRVQPDGTLFAATPQDGGLWQIEELGVEIANDANGEGDGRLNRFVLSFGEDDDKELYVGLIELGGPTGSTGAVYRFASVAASEEPTDEEPTGAGEDMDWLLWVLVALAGLALLLFVFRAVRRSRAG